MELVCYPFFALVNSFDISTIHHPYLKSSAGSDSKNQTDGVLKLVVYLHIRYSSVIYIVKRFSLQVELADKPGNMDSGRQGQ
jgi:hypothetical protein